MKKDKKMSQEGSKTIEGSVKKEDLINSVNNLSLEDKVDLILNVLTKVSKDINNNPNIINKDKVTSIAQEMGTSSPKQENGVTKKQPSVSKGMSGPK